jgi:hypothetical protein
MIADLPVHFLYSSKIVSVFFFEKLSFSLFADPFKKNSLIRSRSNVANAIPIASARRASFSHSAAVVFNPSHPIAIKKQRQQE